MNITLRTLIAAAGVAVAFSASAQTATPNIDQRQANQQARIEQGKAIVYSKAEALQQAARIQAKYNQPALIESFVAGIEVEIPIIIDESGPRVT